MSSKNPPFKDYRYQYQQNSSFRSPTEIKKSFKQKIENSKLGRFSTFTAKKPIESSSELYALMRKVTNTDPSRLDAIIDILKDHKRLIIFYSYDYELELLKTLKYHLPKNVEIAEWNGHKHEPIPDSDKWLYFVNYMSGAEGWECITTDTIVFYSQQYSYRIAIQSAGRIDRLNTPYDDLYYYWLKSKAWIDVAIGRAMVQKKDFNERRHSFKF